MAITPIEDLFTYRLHQAYNRSTLAGVSSTNRFGVARYVVEILKRWVPRMKSVSRCEHVEAVYGMFPCKSFHSRRFL
jgi:hypothetical protein